MENQPRQLKVQAEALSATALLPSVEEAAEVIRGLDDPVYASGALVVLKGSLAPRGDVLVPLNKKYPIAELMAALAPVATPGAATTAS